MLHYQHNGGLEDPEFLRRLGELSVKSDRVWLAALSVGLGFTLLAAYLFAFSPTGKFLAYIGLGIRAILYFRAGVILEGCGGEILSDLFNLGLVAGIFEILVDWGLIHWISNGRLVYLTGNDVVLLASPLWMPVAWACAIAELGYPAMRLFRWLRASMTTKQAAIIASLLTGLAASVTVGFYEYLACRANLWRYEEARVMLGDSYALYIPLGEFVMFLAILPIGARVLSMNHRRQAAFIEGGATFTLAIALGYALAYFLLEVRWSFLLLM
ncbi:MAG: hypothetical protein P4L55_01990 [Syntrophobacteraceae bacterium]|nr:hypothetical protein [Syntrophobacteraceae bacterium]